MKIIKILLENDSDLSTMNWYHGTDAGYSEQNKRFEWKLDRL